MCACVCARTCVSLCDCAERINALCEKSSSASGDTFNQVETAAAERKEGAKEEKRGKEQKKSLNVPKNSEAVSFSAYAKTKLYAEHAIQMYLQHCTVR